MNHTKEAVSSPVFTGCVKVNHHITLLVFMLLFLSTTQLVQAQIMPNTTTQYSVDPAILLVGQQLFEDNCSSCHNFSQKSIGPGLSRATGESSKDWLGKFIKNAPEMIASKDGRASRLFEEYKQIMPPFTHLKRDEIEAILGFIHKNQNSATSNDGLEKNTIIDPIPTKIPLTGGKLYLWLHSTAPATGNKAPLARINKMQTLPGKPERQFIVDLQGILYEVKDKEWQAVLDIRKVRPHFTSFPGLGTGFGSFAFHPGFNENRLLYTTHAEKVHGVPGDLVFADSIQVGLQWVLTEWKIRDPLEIPFVCEGREVVRIDMLTTSHGVQEITFNPSARKGQRDYGLLYMGIGDNGSAEKKGFYPLCSSNKTVAGSVLRIDPLGKNSANGRYGIPKTNPYVNEKDPAIKVEIFCRGLRNPNRISWTPDGKMLIWDIGQSNIEEINLGVAGADYGWPEREGRFLVNPRENINQIFALPHEDGSKKYTYPILQYYHGVAVRFLKDKCVFTDITNGRFFVTEDRLSKKGLMAPIKELEIYVNNELTTFQKINDPAKPDPRIGVGPGGELYVFTKADGKLYKVTGYKPAR
jgi:mono/diheme cytochrome c family protein